MPNIVIDESRWPLVIITFHGTATDAEFDDYLAQQSARLAKKQKIAVVIDARTADHTPALQRKKQADWQREHKDEQARYTVGTAFAISSPVVRGMLTAIFWVQPLPCPHHVASTLDGAIDWASHQLRKAGVG